MNRDMLIPLFKWDNKEVSYQLVSGRTVRLQSTATYMDTRTDDRGRTCNVTFEDKFIIKSEDTLELMDEDFPIRFRIRYIERISDVNNMLLLHSHRRTISSYFVLPFLGKNREYFAYDSYFVNSYLYKASSKREKLKFLYVLYMFSNTMEFAELESRLRMHPMYIACSNPDKAHLLYTFRVPEDFLKEIPLFLLGNYSSFSEQSKKAISRFHNFNKNGTMWKILNKDSKLKKEMEDKLKATIPDHIDLFDRPSWTNEIYNERAKD